jgi:Uma2 family endonuclease
MAIEVREVVEARDKPPCPTRRAASIEEFWSLPESTLSVEYINGEIVMAPAPTFDHQNLSRRIFRALDSFVEKEGLGGVFYSPLDVVLPSGEVVQPDIFFLNSKEMERCAVDKRMYGAPSLVVEILSPGSTTLDTLTKRELYEQSGVREYWIVDPEARTVAQLVLRKKRYAVTQLNGDDVLTSVVLKGFETRVGELLGL